MTALRIPAGQWVVVEPAQWLQERISLSDEDHRHLVRVLRLREGDSVGVLDGVGGMARALLAEVTRENAVLVMQERHRVPAPRPAVTLCLALLREAAMDIVLEGAVALGAQRVIVFRAERSVVKCTAEKMGARMSRWQRLVINAARQCGQPWLPGIEGIVSLADVVRETAGITTRCWGSLQHDTRLLREVLRRDGAPPESVAVFIGPEGDFTPEEESFLRASGAVPVSFGAGVLRAETAALFVLSALRYEFDPHIALDWKL